MRQEAEYSQTVVDRDEHDSVLGERAVFMAIAGIRVNQRERREK